VSAITGLHDSGAAERDGVVRARVRGTVVGFAVQPFVFQKPNGIVTANGGAEKATGVERIRWHSDAQAGDVGKRGFAALAVNSRGIGIMEIGCVV
jgi:hypothetical protein